LIDCAPTESILTTAAYLSTDNVLIPVKPEFLSTIGLPLIQQSILEFQKLYRKPLKVTGVCFNICSSYYPEEATSKSDVKTLASQYKWHVFDEQVPFSRSFPKGAREGNAIFQTTYARSTVASQVGIFCNAFAQQVKL
jgi:chromosome partitioning protein